MQQLQDFSLEMAGLLYLIEKGELKDDETKELYETLNSLAIGGTYDDIGNSPLIFDDLKGVKAENFIATKISPNEFKVDFDFIHVKGNKINAKPCYEYNGDDYYQSEDYDVSFDNCSITSVTHNSFKISLCNLVKAILNDNIYDFLF